MINKDVPKLDLAKANPLQGYIWAIIAGLIGFLLYANTIGHGYVLDDNEINKNSFVQQGISGIPKLFTVDFWYFENLKLGYYRPLSLVSFAVEHQIFGRNPSVSHFDNALLYGLSSFLLVMFLIQILPLKHPIFYFLIGLVFITHPIHTEVVANIKSREEILSFLNLLAMFLCAFQYQKTKNKYLFFLSLVFFYLALISKETATVGVVLLPVLLFYSGHKILPTIKKTLPYAGVVILFYLQKMYFLGTESAIIYGNIISYPYTSPQVKVPTVFHIFSLCLGKLLFPWPLTYDYSYNQVPASHWGGSGTFLGIALFISLAILAVVGMLKRTIWGLGLSFILITLVPSLAFVYLRGGIMAERFLYAPCLGFAILLFYILSNCFPKLDGPKLKIPDWLKNNGIISGIVIFICVIYSVETVARNMVWKNQFTLYSTDVSHSTNSCLVHDQYAIELIGRAGMEKDSVKRKNDFDLGISELNTALAINPDFEQALFELGIGYQSVEVNLDSSIKYYKKCIKVSPNYARAYTNIGIIYQNVGKLQLASYYYNRAAEVDTQYEDGVKHAADLKKTTNLDVHVFPGEDTIPLSIIKKIKNVSSESPEVINKFNTYYLRGADEAKNGDFAAGIKDFKKAAEIIPDNKLNLEYLANSYGMTQHYKEAISTYKLILKKFPDDQLIIKNLAHTYDLMGQINKGDEIRKKLK